MTNLVNLIKKRYIQHFVGWFSLLITMLIIANLENKTSLIEDVLGSLGLLSMLITVTYIHFYLLRFLLQKRYTIYLLSTSLLIISISVLNYYLLHFIEISVNNNGLIAEIIFFLFVIFFGTGLRFIKRGFINQYKIRALKVKQIKTEYNLLKAQVNPHFLFNTLNNMYALSLKKDDKLSDMILELSDLMRYQLESSTKTNVKLEDEINYLSNYVKLENIRVQRFCNIDFNVTGLFNDKNIAPLLFIPFIENAFKYGISVNKENYINIIFKISDTKLYFYIENKIIATKRTDNTTGTGIDNVRSRLNILYPNKYILKISEQNSIFSVTLNIDL